VPGRIRTSDDKDDREKTGNEDPVPEAFGPVRHHAGEDVDRAAGKRADQRQHDDPDVERQQNHENQAQDCEQHVLGAGPRHVVPFAS
jgi:hypothetical protein